jgi:hypothetical protein
MVSATVPSSFSLLLPAHARFFSRLICPALQVSLRMARFLFVRVHPAGLFSSLAA